ncbi:hypothetical protein LIER_35714 [Lithospermum erythrorhizon]|uniref:Uncharacterized protein n=1 Tax=Lithospermum erythrorhizon TaxID=34254 RepID=A0AAV3NVB5_LITER
MHANTHIDTTCVALGLFEKKSSLGQWRWGLINPHIVLPIVSCARVPTILGSWPPGRRRLGSYYMLAHSGNSEMISVSENDNGI